MPSIICDIIEVCVFTFKDSQPFYLVLKRSADDALYPGTWQIVSGTIEKNETAVHASLRELEEETGFTPARYWVAPIVNSFFDSVNDVLHHSIVFLAEVDEYMQPALSAEHSEFLWCSEQEAIKLLAWPGQINAIEISSRFIINGKEASTLTKIK